MPCRATRIALAAAILLAACGDGGDPYWAGNVQPPVGGSGGDWVAGGGQPGGGTLSGSGGAGGNNFNQGGNVNTGGAAPNAGGSASGDHCLIDNMDDCDHQVHLADGRAGYWYVYNSNCELELVAAGTQWPPAAPCGGVAEPFSMMSAASGCSARTYGNGFPYAEPNWGYAGIGFDLMADGSGYNTCAYEGITVTLSGTPARMKIVTPPLDNSNHVGVMLTEGNHTVTWDQLASESWGPIKVFDCASVHGFQFEAADPTMFDFRVDDIEFVGGTCAPVVGTGGTGGAGTGGTVGVGGTGGTDVPDEWICPDTYYGSGDACDCGCGAEDPDCRGLGCATPNCNAVGCEYCHDALGNAVSCLGGTGGSDSSGGAAGTGGSGGVGTGGSNETGGTGGGTSGGSGGSGGGSGGSAGNTGGSAGTGGGTGGDAGCTEGPAHDITLAEIAVYQTGKIPVMQNAGTEIPAESRYTSIVEGKSALVRGFVQLGSGWQAREVTGRLTLASGDESTSYSSVLTPVTDSLNNDLSTTFNWELPASALTPSVRYRVDLVECETTAGTVLSPSFPADGDVPLGTRQVGPLKLTLVPVVMNGYTPDTSSATIAIYHDLLHAMYPADEVQLTVREAWTSPYTVSAGGDGWASALDALRDLRSDDGAAADMYYYGLLTPAASFRQYCQSGCVAGLGYLVSEAGSWGASMRAAMGIAYGDRGAGETLAHELGHNHGREHAPCGVTDPDLNYPHAGGVIGWWGYEYPDVLYEPDEAVDIMSYCSYQWVSDYTYDGLMERIASLNGAAMQVVPQELSGRWRVLLDEPSGPHWGLPIDQPTAPTGTPELARVLDADGDVVDEVVVYRTRLSALGASSILVPEPEAHWFYIELDNGVTVEFE